MRHCVIRYDEFGFNAVECAPETRRGKRICGNCSENAVRICGKRGEQSDRCARIDRFAADRSKNRAIGDMLFRFSRIQVYLNNLDNIVTLRRLVTFYIEEYNSTLPHSAFRGQTPDEMYFGTGAGVEEKLELGKQNARELRLATNRQFDCEQCKETPEYLSVAT